MGRGPATGRPAGRRAGRYAAFGFPGGRRDLRSMIPFARMTILYYSPGAASLLVHWLLLELGVAHELRAMDFATREHKRPEYLALNPSGVVPTLVLAGRPMPEAAANAMHLPASH